MFFDELLAVVAAAAPAVASYLGWRLISTPLDIADRKRKLRFEIGFILCGLVGILTVAIIAHRGNQISATLESIKAGQQAANKGIQTIEQGAKQHARVNWIAPTVPNHMGQLFPYHAGEIPRINVGFTNGGDLALRNATMRAMIIITPTQYDGSVFSLSSKHLAMKPSTEVGVLNAHNNEVRYETYIGVALTRELAKQLNKGEKSFCVVGIADWRDDNGHHETYLSRCLLREVLAPSLTYNWHINNEDEEEHALP